MSAPLKRGLKAQSFPFHAKRKKAEEGKRKAILFTFFPHLLPLSFLEAAFFLFRMHRANTHWRFVGTNFMKFCF